LKFVHILWRLIVYAIPYAIFFLESPSGFQLLKSLTKSPPLPTAQIPVGPSPVILDALSRSGFNLATAEAVGLFEEGSEAADFVAFEAECDG
jgi:hypothetical protein